ncbi:hypothetical protein GBAR_LOCUS8918, partial [Geodia barretti]
VFFIAISRLPPPPSCCVLAQRHILCQKNLECALGQRQPNDLGWSRYGGWEEHGWELTRGENWQQYQHSFTLQWQKEREH